MSRISMKIIPDFFGWDYSLSQKDGILPYMNTGELILLYRRKRRMTQEALAREIDATKAYISAVEKGSKTISDKQLWRLAKILRIPEHKVRGVQIGKAFAKVGSGFDYDIDEVLNAKKNLERFLSAHGHGGSPKEVIWLPVVGKIPAGTPLASYEDAMEASEEMFPVPSSETRHSRCFFLQATGDSMIEIGIADGDYVLIDPEERDVGGIGRVMAVDIDGEVTLKTVVRINAHELMLVSENKRYAPKTVDMKKKPVMIIGLVLPFMAKRNPKLAAK